MTLLKTLIFYSVVAAFTFTFFLLVFWMMAVPGRKHLYWGCQIWLRLFVLWGRIIWGVRFEVTGLEHLPRNQTVILASKHQSLWETFLFFIHIPDAVFVLKRELLWIPIWGWWLARYGAVAIDRKAGIKAMQKILRSAKKYKNQNRVIVIYPEGTRVLPEVRAPLKAGVAAIYQALDVPIVPVALNSGYFFPKRGVRRPGLIRIALQPPLPAGLPKKDMMQKLEQILYEESLKLKPDFAA